MSTPKSPRTKASMIEFLEGHFRYPTMNFLNGATSYARNIKIHCLDLDHETTMKCYEMLDIKEAFWEFQDVREDFAIRHDYKWQIGQNGRSGGYLVLYQGGRKELDYTTRCDRCFRPTWYKTEQSCHHEGCGGTLQVLKTAIQTSFTSGHGTDDKTSFEDWTHEELSRRVVLVKDFDRTCNLAVEAFVDYAKSHKVEEQEIMVPKMIKVAIEA